MTGPIPRIGKFYVYILACSDGTFYTGFTPNLKKRVATHNKGRGAKYTRDRRPVRLIWSKRYRYFKHAILEERRIKRLSRAKKEELIRPKKRGAPRAEARGTKIFSPVGRNPARRPFNHGLKSVAFWLQGKKNRASRK